MIRFSVFAKLGGFSLLAILLFSCSNSKKIAALKPVADKLTSTKLTQQNSFIAVPISISFSELEKQLNANLQGLIYNDTDLDDDKLELQITKLNPIKISGTNGKINLVLPLKMSGKFKYGSEAFGLNLYDTKSFSGACNISLSSSINLQNWQLNSKTEITNIDWIEAPNLSIAGKSIPLSYLIKPALNYFKKDIEKALDENIVKASNFKPMVIDALQKMAEPIQLNKEFNTWLQLNPLEFYLSNAQITTADISVKAGLKCELNTFIGEKPAKNNAVSNIILKPSATFPNKVELAVAAITSYTEAAKLMQQNFNGQTFTSGKKSITITQTELWPKDGKLIIAVELAGSLNGTIYLSGMPKYDATKKEIYFADLNYTLDTKDKLLKLGNWLAQGWVLKKMEASCHYSIAKELADAKKQAEQYLGNYSPSKGIYIKGLLSELDFESIELTSSNLAAVLKVKGNLSVQLSDF